MSAKKLVIVESPAKAKTIAGYLGRRLRRRVEHRPHSRPSEPRLGDPGGHEEGALGAARRRRRARLRAAVRRRLGQEGEGQRAEEAPEERRRAPARDRRRPRGRGDRLASARGAAAEGARAPDGLPRDHPRRDPARARRDARGRPAPRRRPGDAAHPRPPLRLRGLAGALEEGHAGALRRPRPVGGGPARRRARARAPRLRLGGLLGHQGPLRSRLVRGQARRGRRAARRAGTRLRPGRHAQVGRSDQAGRGPGARARRGTRRRSLCRALRRREAVHAPAGRAVHDLDAAAGGGPQASLHRADDDARRPAPVRERLHHLHAHRLDDAVRVGAAGRAQAGRRALRRRLDPGRAAPVHAQGEERAGGARGDPSGRRLVPDAEAARARAQPRRARALRPDLEADAGLADGRRARHDRLAPPRGEGGFRHRRRVLGLRHRDHVPRLPRRVRGEPRRRGTAPEERSGRSRT